MNLTRRSILAAFATFMSGCGFIPKPVSSIKLAVKLNDFGRKVFETEHWYVELKKDQSYLGSCTIRLKRVEDMFGGLTPDEWLQFLEVVRLMELAAKSQFGASHVNWSCLMNHGYRSWPIYTPLVHIHFHPRYLNTEVSFAGLLFRDEDPTSHYKPYTMRSVPQEVEAAIIQTYRKEISRISALC